MHKHKVLIVGGGFGGIKTALELRDRDDVEITLLSDHADFRYYPTFFHTATGGLKSQSSIPLSAIIDERITFVLGKAAQLNREQKLVTTTDGRNLPYDTLVLGVGVVTNYFGIKGLREYSYSIKSIDEIQEFKRHLHMQLVSERKPDLNYVIVGGGPTGIELAGALPQYLRKIMRSHGIHRRAVHIDVIEAAPRLLPRSSKRTSRAVRRRLRKLGVRLYLNQTVEGQTADTLMVNGKPVQSHTVVWTAGVTNHPFYKDNHFTLNERGKVVVNELLQTEQNIFVVGDNAATPYSGLAQTALYDAVFVAETIAKLLEGKKTRPYVPKQPVTVIPVGAGWAAVEWGKLHFAGWIGWLLRSAADWIGYHDFQPWWKASEQWLTEFGTEEDCVTCITTESQKTRS